MTEYLQELDDRFKIIFDWLCDEFTSIRTNRPTAKLIENIKVDYFGQQLLLKQISTIVVEPPCDLIVSTWDKGSLQATAKSLESANLGVGVAVQGNIIRVTLPQLTGERREELKRIVKSTSEEARIRMRVQRDEVHKKIKNLSEDEKFRGKDGIQKLVDEFNASVLEMIDRKNKEIDE
ncbi:MAG: ribosome-recycling factor [bacterium]